ncbi:hypothetical protein HmCmsJML191_02190 [Escherichia coli]|nr:hypothetical protein HmCmsJML191_02190 [Escherichia coli]
MKDALHDCFSVLKTIRTKHHHDLVVYSIQRNLDNHFLQYKV